MKKYQLEVSMRAYNCLYGMGIDTIKNLLKYSKEDLMGIKNLGKKTIAEIEKRLKEIGLELRKKTCPYCHFDNTKYKFIAKSEWDGPIKKKPKGYWHCLNCSKTFNKRDL